MLIVVFALLHEFILLTVFAMKTQGLPRAILSPPVFGCCSRARRAMGRMTLALCAHRSDRG